MVWTTAPAPGSCRQQTCRCTREGTDLKYGAWAEVLDQCGENQTLSVGKLVRMERIKGHLTGPTL
jgi:hypothetical protein